MTTLADIKEIVKQLKSEKNPINEPIIAYYEKMIPEWTVKAYDKAISKIGNITIRNFKI